MVNTKKNQYSSEHKLFTFTPTDSSDYEIFEDMKIDQELKQYTDWFKNNQVSAKKYNFILVDESSAGAFEKNSRSNKIAFDFLKKHIDSCKIIIFDDSKRLHEQLLIKDFDIDANLFNFIDINFYKNYPQTRMRIYFKKELENIVYRNANLASNIL